MIDALDPKLDYSPYKQIGAVSEILHPDPPLFPTPALLMPVLSWSVFCTNATIICPILMNTAFSGSLRAEPNRMPFERR